jgi:large subunit ribosomal protein L20
MRSTNSVASRSRRKKVLKQAKGMQQARRRSYKMAKQAVIRSLQYATRDRKDRKRVFRQLWIKRLSSSLEGLNTNYSTFINNMKNKNIEVNRKTLSEIAISDTDSFKSFVEYVSK